MTILAGLEKELSTLRARREKKAREVAEIRKPMDELAELERQEAAALTAKAAAEAERDQLMAERDDLALTVSRITVSEADIKTALKTLDAYERALGRSTDAYTRAAFGIGSDQDHRAACRRRIAAIDARLREIAE